MKKVFLDTETTDLTPGQICQLSYIVVDGKVMFAKNFFFKVEKVESGALNVHGLSVPILVLLSQGMTFKDHSEEIIQDLKDGLLICHNTNFDSKFMKEEFRRIGVNSVMKERYCTMEHYTNIIQIPSPYREGQYKYPRLSELMEYLEIEESEVLERAKQLFHCDDVGFHDSRFDTMGLYMAFEKGMKTSQRLTEIYNK